MLFEFLSKLSSLPSLHHEHDSQGFSRLKQNNVLNVFNSVRDLMRPKLVDEVVHVNEQEVDVVNLFLPPWRLWALNQDVDQVKKIDQNRVVQFS